jgi:hypothetical protein
VTRIGATQTRAMIDDFRARKAGPAVGAGSRSGSGPGGNADGEGY